VSINSVDNENREDIRISSYGQNVADHPVAASDLDYQEARIGDSGASDGESLCEFTFSTM